MSEVWEGITKSMKKDESLFCDICGNEIPKREKFWIVSIPSGQLLLYLHLYGFKKKASTWTCVDDDRIRLDICDDCHVLPEIGFREQLSEEGGKAV